MNFPQKDLSLQHISQSYQGLLQQHGEYVLDGLGNVVFSIGSSSLSGSAYPTLLQSDQTSSMVVGVSTIALTSSIAYYADAADTASYAHIANVAINAINAVTASYLAGSIESAVNATYAQTASYAPDYIKKSGDVATGDIIGTDFVKTRSGTITRDTDGNIEQIQYIGGRTLTITRTAGYVSSVTDGTRTWTYSRDSENLITGWTVTT